MTSLFHPILDTYAKGKINSVNFDMDEDSISVAIIGNQEPEPIEIKFEDVRAFYYIDHDLKSELLFSHDQLNVIAYDTYGFGEFSAAANHDSDFVSIPNFAVNLKDSSLYIDADKIRINNKRYHVK